MTMIHIFAGEDEINARKAFLQKKEELIGNGYAVQDLTDKELLTLDSWLSRSQDLFAQKKAFFYDRGIGDKKRKEVLAFYDKDSTIELYILDTTTYQTEIKRLFPTAPVTFFAPSETGFCFLGGLSPQGGKVAVTQMQQLLHGDQDFGFFYMLRKRVRELLSISLGHQPASIKQAWQLGRLQTQARKWDTQSLMSFYESLYRIEKNAKTSGSTYNLKQSLEIVFSIL